ncbi:MAG: MmcQ/YjbR family DNA-binding protein [Akkermansiaceae bacterium]
MDLDQLIQQCMSYPEVEETSPFGPDTLVYKVCGKMFALTSPDSFPTAVNLKCDPDRALELRDEYDAVKPGYHMNKKHWNTVTLDGSVPSKLIEEMIVESLRLVVQSLKKADRERIQAKLA